jgi:hypothetical protein
LEKSWKKSSKIEGLKETRIKMTPSHQFCLKWNNHSNNLLKVFGRLFSNESFTDVTLAAEGRSVRAHKVSTSMNLFE